MKVLLDTTYLLPLAGIRVEGVEGDVLSRVRSAGHLVFVSEVSLFELVAKAAKLSARQRFDDDRVSVAVQSVLRDEEITKVSPYEESVVRMSIELRRHHSDFIDCVILASAMEKCEVLLTEDAALSKGGVVLEIATRDRPGFRIVNSRTLLKG